MTLCETKNWKSKECLFESEREAPAVFQRKAVRFLQRDNTPPSRVTRAILSPTSSESERIFTIEPFWINSGSKLTTHQKLCGKKCNMVETPAALQWHTCNCCTYLQMTVKICAQKCCEQLLYMYTRIFQKIAQDCWVHTYTNAQNKYCCCENVHIPVSNVCAWLGKCVHTHAINMSTKHMGLAFQKWSQKC